MSRVVEEMCEEEDGKNILKMNKTAFGVCHEIFTIYGNVTLRYLSFLFYCFISFQKF